MFYFLQWQYGGIIVRCAIKQILDVLKHSALYWIIIYSTENNVL